MKIIFFGGFPETLNGTERESLSQHPGAGGEERMLVTWDLAQFGLMPPTFMFKLHFLNFFSSFNNDHIGKALNS